MSSDQAGCSSDLNWIELPVVESGLNHFLISLNPSHDPCKLCGTISWLKAAVGRSLMKPLSESGCWSCCPSSWPHPWLSQPKCQTGNYQRTTSFLTADYSCQQSTFRDGAASDPNDPFGDIEDPSKQCLDINCYEPVVWDDGQVERNCRGCLWHCVVQEEVCRYRTKSECEPRSQEVCQQVNLGNMLGEK